MNLTLPMQQTPNEAVDAFTRNAVRDVFKKMLAIEVKDDKPAPLAEDAGGQIVGSVGFTGKATGIIYLSATASMGQFVTRKMLGLSEAEVDDDMINDAFGELCNMVVGSVKSHLCDCGWSCVLTVPSIVRGKGLSIKTIADVKRTSLGFLAGEQRLLVEVTVKNLPF
ncbi:MAG: chemotaxis protein CheX [Pedosphaera sp.]|nr:chemotaxis protein CheX [Pedosphaera sp.]